MASRQHTSISRLAASISILDWLGMLQYGFADYNNNNISFADCRRHNGLSFTA